MDDVRFSFKQIGEKVALCGKLEDEYGVVLGLRGLLIFLITHEGDVFTILEAGDDVAMAEAF